MPAVSAPPVRDPVTGAPLVLCTRRIVLAGVHDAPGAGAQFYAPAGVKADELPRHPPVVRYWVTPYKAFPILHEGFLIPPLRCRGGGITISAPEAPPRPHPAAMRLGDITSPVPIPWPLGSLGNPGPDYVPPKHRGKATKVDRP